MEQEVVPEGFQRLEVRKKGKVVGSSFMKRLVDGSIVFVAGEMMIYRGLLPDGSVNVGVRRILIQRDPPNQDIIERLRRLKHGEFLEPRESAVSGGGGGGAGGGTAKAKPGPQINPHRVHDPGYPADVLMRHNGAALEFHTKKYVVRDSGTRTQLDVVGGGSGGGRQWIKKRRLSASKVRAANKNNKSAAKGEKSGKERQ